MSKRPSPYRSVGRAAVAKPAPELQNEIASTRDGRDITQPWVRGLREAKDPKLATAVDWGAYDIVFNDDQVFSTMQQRIGAVVARDWNVIAGETEDPRAEKAAEAFDTMMKRLPWDRVTRKMLMASFYGYSVAELMWGYRDGRFDIVGIKVRHARRFRYDDEDRLRMLTPTNMQGEIMPDRKFWVHAVGAADDDQPYGHGLAHWLYWPTLFKRNGIRFWNIFLDKFGTPTAKGTYPRGSSKEDINKLLMALQAIATDSGFVVPDGMAVELLGAARSGTGDYHQLCLYMDAAIAKIVLSQTMTTDNGSSRSQGEVHADVKLEVVKTDADDLTDSFAQVARWWTDFNFGPDVAAPIVRRIVEEEEDAKANAETDKIHGENGWVRTEESFQDTYGEGFVRRDDKDAPSGSAAPTKPEQLGHNGGPARDDVIPSAANDDVATTRKVASFAADDPRPLYVYRQLLNASEVLDWAASQGFTTTLAADDLHVTQAYSRRPVNWFAMGQSGPGSTNGTGDLIIAPGGPRLIERLGDGSAVALLFQSLDLQWRHREMRDAGASWDHPSYLPHITLSYEAGDIDLANVQPYQGRLIFGPERFEAIQSDWNDGRDETPTAAASFAETADEHDDADSIVDRMIAEDGYRVAGAMTGTLMAQLVAADNETEARSILAEGLGLMDEAPLIQAIERAGFAVQIDATTQPATQGEK